VDATSCVATSHPTATAAATARPSDHQSGPRDSEGTSTAGELFGRGASGSKLRGAEELTDGSESRASIEAKSATDAREEAFGAGDAPCAAAWGGTDARDGAEGGTDARGGAEEDVLARAARIVEERLRVEEAEPIEAPPSGVGHDDRGAVRTKMSDERIGRDGIVAGDEQTCAAQHPARGEIERLRFAFPRRGERDGSRGEQLHTQSSYPRIRDRRSSTERVDRSRETVKRIRESS